MSLSVIAIVVSVASAIISGCALIVSIRQMIIQRSHNKMSMIPKLDSDSTSYKGFEYIWRVENRGVGPAVILKHTFTIGGNELINPSLATIGAALDAKGVARKSAWHELEVGNYLPAGYSCTLLEISPVDAEEYAPLFKRMKWIIEYKSIYGDNYIENITAIDHE